MTIKQENALTMLDLLLSNDVATVNKNWAKFREMIDLESMIKYAEIGEEKKLELNLTDDTCWQYL